VKFDKYGLIINVLKKMADGVNEWMNGWMNEVSEPKIVVIKRQNKNTYKHRRWAAAWATK